ncbi:MAG: septal ring lytic transglycosylase RlpA family protein [Melioribacteraceae bacterium]|nr:septal ring lytic transglycosylase RlpA family protein [Melioribacteraceae bacterium]
MKFDFYGYIKWFLLLAVLVVVSCSSAPRFKSKNSEKESPSRPRYFSSEKADTLFNPPETIETVIGYASYYADDFDGKTTSNGETFNMYELTAAHRTYPFNTMIRVTNLSNNKTVIVRINDRGPVPPDRIIDLSLGAAQLIDMIEEGIPEVKLEILEWGIE